MQYNYYFHNSDLRSVYGVECRGAEATVFAVHVYINYRYPTLLKFQEQVLRRAGLILVSFLCQTNLFLTHTIIIISMYVL